MVLSRVNSKDPEYEHRDLLPQDPLTQVCPF